MKKKACARESFAHNTVSIENDKAIAEEKKSLDIFRDDREKIRIEKDSIGIFERDMFEVEKW